MLCAGCQAIDLRFIDEFSTNEQEAIKQTYFGDSNYWTSVGEGHHYYYGILHDDFSALSSSVQHGCHLCAAIYAAFTISEPWWGLGALNISRASEESFPIVIRVWSSKRRKPFVENVLASEKIYDEFQVWYRAAVRKYRIINDLTGDLAQASYNLGLAISETGSYDGESTTGSPGTLALLKAWLRRCEANHPQCRAPKLPLPTRLVDVGPFDRTATPQVKLSTATEEGDYIALSHCWGDAIYLAEIRGWASDTSNLPPLDEWPRTFRETIEICKSLEIRYLWIDTLCIDQRDPEDFAREAAKMAEYYTGATLVVAATHAKDSREGCFATRDPLLVRPCPVKFKGFTEREIFIALLPEEKGEHTPKVAPLDSRAWVWQETLLGRRSANFNRDQLSWSCILNRAHESRPEGRNIDEMHPQFTPVAFLRTFIHHPLRAAPATEAEGEDPEMHRWLKSMFGLYDMYNARYRQAVPDPNDLPRDPAYQKWYDCVEKFTDRDITYATDALPAMSGLAKKMHEALGGNNVYQAGLWSEDLIRGLLWAVFGDPDRRKQEEPIRYVAPSWSWASRIGHRISYFFDETIMCETNPKVTPNTTELMKILKPRDIRVETELKYAGAKYGEVTSGALHCKARLLHACRVTQFLIETGSSIYHRPHPAYHRGLGGTQKNDWIRNWGLVIPAAWAVHENLDKDGKKKAKPLHDKTGPGEIMAELAFDGSRAPSEAIVERKPRIKWAEVHVLLLWPFRFQEDRVMGLGLVRTAEGGTVYRRVGRVETAIPHKQLWDWAMQEDGLEDVTII